MNKLLLVVMLLMLAVPGWAKDPIRIISGQVTKISDGDTIQVVDAAGVKVKVRIYGIDAPETSKGNNPGQPFGEDAKTALVDMIYHQQVRLEVQAIDRYKRLVSLVFLNDKNVSLEMVKMGYAWAYKKYLERPSASEYIEAENEARRSKIGIWKDNNPQPPWEFRKISKLAPPLPSF